MGDGERFWEMFTSVACVVGLWPTTHTSGGEQLPNRGLFTCRDAEGLYLLHH